MPPVAVQRGYQNWHAYALSENVPQMFPVMVSPDVLERISMRRVLPEEKGRLHHRFGLYMVRRLKRRWISAERAASQVWKGTGLGQTCESLRM